MRHTTLATDGLIVGQNVVANAPIAGGRYAKINA